MSPSWRDRFCIALAPGRVAVLRLKRGWRPRLDADAVLECGHAGEAADKPGAPWTGALAAVDAVLAELAPAGGVADVVLSNHFVRYGQMPWTQDVYAEADRQILAAGCFRAVYGEAADAWRVVVDAPRYNSGSLAAAVDKALVDGLAGTLGRRRLRLASLQPYLTAAFRRQRLEADDGGFLLVEPGCVTLLFRRQDRWAEVANRRCPSESAAETGQIVRQCIEADRLQGGKGTVAVWAPGAAPMATEPWGRPLAGDGGPWPEDPWRTMAWSVA